VLRSVSSAMGTWIEPVAAPRRVGDVRHTRAEITRARELLDWEPQARWEWAVSETVNWFEQREAEA
jgi:UDP-glucose 4-epimerase